MASHHSVSHRLATLSGVYPLNGSHPPFTHLMCVGNTMELLGVDPPSRGASPFSASGPTGMPPPTRRVASPPLSYGSGPPSFGSGPPSSGPPSYGGAAPPNGAAASSGSRLSNPPTSSGGPPSMSTMSRGYSPPPPPPHSTQNAFAKVTRLWVCVRAVPCQEACQGVLLEHIQLGWHTVGYCVVMAATTCCVLNSSVGGTDLSSTTPG